MIRKIGIFLFFVIALGSQNLRAENNLKGLLAAVDGTLNAINAALDSPTRSSPDSVGLLITRALDQLQEIERHIEKDPSVDHSKLLAPAKRFRIQVESDKLQDPVLKSLLDFDLVMKAWIDFKNLLLRARKTGLGRSRTLPAISESTFLIDMAIVNSGMTYVQYNCGFLLARLQKK
jgi:hypothetical protein